MSTGSTLARALAVTLAFATAGGGGAIGAEGGGATSFLKWLLGFDIGGHGVLGGGAVAEGSLWIVPFQGGEATRLTEGADFARPVFAPGGRMLLARRGSALVRVDTVSGAVETLASVPGLIAPLAEAADGEVLAMVAGDPLPIPVSVAGGVARPVDAPDLDAWTQIARAALRERKSYPGNRALEVDTTRESLRRGEPSVEIFAVEGDRRRQLTSCRPDSCVHPALEPASGRVAFIRGNAP